MRNIGKTATLITFILVLILLTGETVWAFCLQHGMTKTCIVCRKNPRQDRPPDYKCEIIADPDPPGDRQFGDHGIAKFVIGKSGVKIREIDNKYTSLPPGWTGQICLTMDGNELHMIPEAPILKENRWPFSFSVESDSEGLFEWHTIEFKTRLILEQGHIIIEDPQQ
jgi:hypothetical protein